MNKEPDGRNAEKGMGGDTGATAASEHNAAGAFNRAVGTTNPEHSETTGEHEAEKTVSLLAEEETEDPKSFLEAPYRFLNTSSESIILNNGTLQYTELDFSIPGRNGFDLVITRRYNSDSAGITEMQPSYVSSSNSFTTVSRENHHNVKTYGLGVGWYFLLPSIETVPESERKKNVIYEPFLHLDSGQNFTIEKMSSAPKLKDHPFYDVTMARETGTVNHPYAPGVSLSYEIAVSYKNGNKDYFKEKKDSAGKLESYTLVARKDRYNNVICYEMIDYGGMTITDSWGRTIKLNRAGGRMTWELPDGSGVRYELEEENGARKLAATRDRAGRRTGYAYHDSAVYKARSKVGSDNSDIQFPFMLLKKITHPTGAETEYEYGTGVSTPPVPIEMTIGTKNGFRRYFPIRKRRDISNNTEYNLKEYTYVKGTGNKHISETTVILRNNVLEKHSFNDKNLQTGKEIRHSGKLVDSGAYTYGTSASSANYKQRIKELAKHYDPEQNSIYLEKTTNWTYDTGFRLNTTKVLEEYTYSTLDQETNMEYDTAYSIMTRMTYKKGSDIIEEEYELRPDKKLPLYKRIYEDAVLKEKTGYVYGGGDDDRDCITEERRYYTGGQGTLESALKYYSTHYAYDAGKYTHSPVKTEAKDVIDADGRNTGGVTAETDYDVMGRVKTNTDALGGVTAYTYDRLGRVLTEAQPAVNGETAVKTYLYDDTKNYIVETDERGYKQRYEYTPLGMIDKACIAAGDAPSANDILLTEHLYDNIERVIQENSYDGEGNIRAVVNYSYDSFDRVLTKDIPQTYYLETHTYWEVYVDPEEATNKHFKHRTVIAGETGTPDVTASELINQAGWTEEEFTEETRAARNTYDNLGNRISRTDALGNETQWEYDYAGRELKSTRTVGSAEQSRGTAYDELGNRTESTDYNGNTSYFEYDSLGRMIRQETPFDTRTAVTKQYYDANGNLISQRVDTGILWRETQYMYDARNRQTDMTAMFNGKDNGRWIRTRYIYDAAGNRIETITGQTEREAGRAAVKYSYDRFGNILTVTDATGQIESREYDNTGRITAKTDRNKDRTEYTHDALGKLKSEKVTVNTLLGKEIYSERAHTYSRTGAKVTDTVKETVNGAVKSNLEMRYAYNGRGQLIKQNDPGGVIKEYIYDDNGNKESFTLSRNEEEEISLYYVYDELNRLIEIYRGGAQGVLIAAYGYDANSNRISTSYPGNSLDTEYEYNEANLVISMENKKGSTVLSSYTYEYSADGNQVSKTETRKKNGNSETKTVTYEYDGIGRLVKEDDPEWQSIAYEYDRFSNRSRMTVETDENLGMARNYVTEYEYDENNRLTKEVKRNGGRWGTSETHWYFYDANGNQARREKEVLKPRTGIEPGSIKWVKEKSDKPTLDLREYNGFGQLVYCNRDTVDIYYIYRPDNLRHSSANGERIKGEPVTTAIHHWDGGSIVMESSGNGSIKSRFIRGKALVSQEIGINSFYYLFNAHGDVIQKVNQLGDISQSYEYDAFGNQRQEQTANSAPNDGLDTDPNPFRYCGEYLDTSLLEYYLRARMYNQNNGRFTTEDPANAGENWFVYTDNNPILRSDPSGYGWTEVREVDGLQWLYYYATGGKFIKAVLWNQPGSGSSSGNGSSTVAASGIPGVSLDAGGPVIKLPFMDVTPSSIEKKLPLFKQGDWTNHGFSSNFAVNACYATSILAIALYYGFSITMEDLVDNGNILKYNAYVNYSTPYFTMESVCQHDTPDVYGPYIQKELDMGHPVIISLEKSNTDHYVVAVRVDGSGVSNSQIHVMDPATGTHKNLEEVLTGGVYSYYGLRITRKIEER